MSTTVAPQSERHRSANVIRPSTAGFTMSNTSLCTSSVLVSSCPLALSLALTSRKKVWNSTCVR